MPGTRAAAAVAGLPELERRSLEFVDAFLGTDLPGAVKEAALFNLSTLKTQTCFRTADGRFYGWEGCNDAVGCCPGSCTHVWNYEQALAYLFGDLAKSMREVEFAHATDAEGKMSFRVMLPLRERATEFGSAAADGQLGCVMKLYREWRLSGDHEFLAGLWPHCGGRWNTAGSRVAGTGDCDGVMEGCQHNTMDVEYFGPNPQMQGWYLGALRAAEEMAGHLGEEDFALKCRPPVRGRQRLGRRQPFQRRVLRAPDRPDRRSGRHRAGPADRIDGRARSFRPRPAARTGLPGRPAGRTVLCPPDGLGYLLSPENVAATHSAIMRHNFRRSFFHHFNHARTYVLNDEQGPADGHLAARRAPQAPVPYANEVMTGFEYTAAVGMILRGSWRRAWR